MPKPKQTWREWRWIGSDGQTMTHPATPNNMGDGWFRTYATLVECRIVKPKPAKRKGRAK